MMNLGFEGQSTQDLQTNNQQDSIQNQNEKQASQEDRYLNFDNYIKNKSHQQYWKACISNDEKYLAVLGRKFNKIQIFYLKNKKIIKNIQSDNKKIFLFKIIKFSNNSKYLLIIDDFGYLYCYDINNNFKQIYYQKLHKFKITDILTIDDDLVLTSSSDQSLIITNIKSNQQLLKIENAHELLIHGIDFDKSNDFIISCSQDQTIKFFNRIDGKCQIKQKQAYLPDGIQMIQLISKHNNLISSDEEKLTLWQIDYQRLQLNKLKRFYNNHIYNFTSVLNNNKIVVICDKCIQILDKDLIVLQKTKHTIFIQAYMITRQLNTLNYLIVQGFYDLQILKKVRRSLK